MSRFLWVAAIAVALSAVQLHAAQFVVDQKDAGAKDDNPGTAEKPFLTISKAATLARAGDTVTVKPGVYREYVRLMQSGRADAPIIFRADPPGSVVVSGADLVTDWQPVPEADGLYSTPWTAVFSIGNDDKGQPVEYHPDSAPLWGRCEQAMVDGKYLKPCASLDELKKARTAYFAAADKAASPVLKLEVANLGGPFIGMYSADPRNSKRLYLWLADGSKPKDHQVELASRSLVFGSDIWSFPEGTQYVQLSGFIFRYGATFPQRAAVWLHGKNNTIENCIVEKMSGSGVAVDGTLRRCVIRNNGHCGGGAFGNGFVNEDSLWEGNSWKPIDRGWEAGGLKSCLVDGGVFQRCVFRRNGASGLWFDIHARNILVTECAFIENESCGLFIEISRNIRVVHNLALRNGIGVVGTAGGWATAGIQLAESMNCFIGWNTCVGNPDGIGFREQGPRPMEKTPDYGDIPYHVSGDVVVDNICADNTNFAFAFWGDTPFFGPHPDFPDEKEKFKNEDSWQKYLSTKTIYNPAEMGMVVDRNLYFKKDKTVEMLYGAPWRPKHQVFTDFAASSKVSGFDPHSRSGDPVFEAPAKDNFRPDRKGLAWDLQVGWLTAPTDLEAWMNGFLPAFR